MGSYFKPWRRKIGVVTLMLACVLAANWICSAFAERCLNLFGIGLYFTPEATEVVTVNSMCIVGIFVVSHWLIVIPLTLLSAWLLLSKPRRPKMKSADEPVSEPAV
jgi:hypothetical protein